MPISEANEDVHAIVHATLLGDGWAATGLGSGIISEEGHYVACNEALCELTGYSRTELLEMNAGEKLPANDAARKNFADAATGARPWGFGGLRRKDGTVIGVNYWLARTVVATIPYFVGLLWADGNGPDLRNRVEVMRAHSEELRDEARAVQARVEQQLRRTERRRRSRGHGSA